MPSLHNLIHFRFTITTVVIKVCRQPSEHRIALLAGGRDLAEPALWVKIILDQPVG